MSTRGGTKKDLLDVIRGLQVKVSELSEENTRLKNYLESKQLPENSRPILWRRDDVEKVIADAESDAKRTNRTHYVGAIGFPCGSQIYGDGSLGITDDREMISGLGTVFAICSPDKTTRCL